MKIEIPFHELSPTLRRLEAEHRRVIRIDVASGSYTIVATEPCPAKVKFPTQPNLIPEFSAQPNP